jgi:hypothetical protein
MVEVKESIGNDGELGDRVEGMIKVKIIIINYKMNEAKNMMNS